MNDLLAYIQKLFETCEYIVIAIAAVYLILLLYYPDIIDEIYSLFNSSDNLNELDNHSIVYPSLPQDVKVDNIIAKSDGKEISAPFCCLENLQSTATKEFLAKQQKVTDYYMENELNGKILSKFLSKYKKALSYDNIECPVNYGGMYFFYKRIRPVSNHD